MKKVERRKPAPKAGQEIAFDSTLERIATGMEYYAVSVPADATRSLHARVAVPVLARVNDCEPFKASLYPVGGGRHYLRIRNQVCKAAGIGEGDRVRVQIVVRDRFEDVRIPADLRTALRKAGALAEFEAVPIGERSYLLRLIEQAVKPETRGKRIGDAVQAAQRRAKKTRG